MTDEIHDQIEALVKQRQELWRAGQPTASVEQKLDLAYDEMRRSRAAGLHGSTAEITRRARVELQLEKLMSGEED